MGDVTRMRQLVLAAIGGTLAGAVMTTQVAGPLLAQESKASVYEQLDLFGDIFERIRAQYVEEVDSAWFGVAVRALRNARSARMRSRSPATDSPALLRGFCVVPEDSKYVVTPWPCTALHRGAVSARTSTTHRLGRVCMA
jgi:hypothetical protein